MNILRWLYAMCWIGLVAFVLALIVWAEWRRWKG